MSKILKKVLLLIFVSMAILAISASADSYKDKYNGRIPPMEFILQKSVANTIPAINAITNTKTNILESAV